jgi:hypothetical protein
VSKLTTQRRDEIPGGEFALPGRRRYPIHDESHARAALSMAHYASPAEQAEIKRKVHAKYPDIK